MTATTRRIYCCGCGHDVDAVLTSGSAVYPHRPDLHDLPFWRCDTCGNFVGCHHKTANRTKPLGIIPTPAIKAARQRLHRLVDPLWQRGGWARGKLYAEISSRIGRPYHTAEIRSVDEAREIEAVVVAISEA